jgi:hypothetical protein
MTAKTAFNPESRSENVPITGGLLRLKAKLPVVGPLVFSTIHVYSLMILLIVTSVPSEAHK